MACIAARATTNRTLANGEETHPVVDQQQTCAQIQRAWGQGQAGRAGWRTGGGVHKGRDIRLRSTVSESKDDNEVHRRRPFLRAARPGTPLVSHVAIIHCFSIACAHPTPLPAVAKLPRARLMSDALANFNKRSALDLS